jgi:hypothetical protein
LDLAFLIDAQHDGVLGRVEIEADDVGDLGDQFGVGGEFERLLPAAESSRRTRLLEAFRHVTIAS